MNYAELVAALPLPTVEQTAAFAGHVAENHSWYKHLPALPPGATFVFFLNPHAGEEVEQTADGYVARPLDEGHYFRHHSRLATGDYRERFGHWDYWVNNPRAVTPAEGPFLYGVGPDGRFPLPAEWTRRWSCQLTAFLRGGPMNLDLIDSEFPAFEEYARLRPADPAVARYRELVRAVRGAASWPALLADDAAVREMATQLQLIHQALGAARDDLARMRQPAA